MLTPATVELIIALIPTATKLAGGVLDAANKLADEGYEVPGIEQLRATNEALRQLPDLTPTEK
ncbi:MAG: hypothetical protein WC340_14315 [Kiritimatiellia bacterium]